MAHNKFSGSVDEILENLKKKQVTSPSNDRAVDEILAGLGLETGPVRPVTAQKPEPAKPIPAPVPEEAEPQPEEKPAHRPLHRSRPEPPEEEPKPEPAAEEPEEPEEVLPEPEPEAPAPAVTEPTGEIRLSEPAGEVQPSEPTGEVRLNEPTGEIHLDEEPRQEEVPAEEPEPAAEEPAPSREDTGEIKAPGLPNTIQFDSEFQKFFSESVAVIPDEEPEQHPGFFARFLQRHTLGGESYVEDEDDDELDDLPGSDDEATQMLPDEDGSLPQVEERLPTGQIDLSQIEQEGTPPHEEPAEPEKEKPHRLMKLFGFHEEGETFEEEAEKEYIEDYENLEDAPAVEAELGKMRAGFILRTAVSGLLALVMLYLGLCAANGNLPSVGAIDPVTAPAAYLSANILLLLVAGAVNWRVFAKGVPGLWSVPTPDTVPALAAIGAAVQLVFQLIRPDQFDPAVTLFAAPAAFLLFFNALGRMLMSGVVLRNFQMVSSGEEHTAAALVNNRELAESITKELGEPEPCLLANRPTSLVKGFLSHSFSGRASDVTAQKVSWILLGAAVISGLICLFSAQGLNLALTAFAGTLCLGGPLAATLLSAVPAILMQKSAARVGAVIPGWSAVSQLGRANVVVAGAKDLFPTGSVRLHAIKTFEKQRIDLAILYAASVLIKGCDTLRDVFMNIIQDRIEILYPAENLENHPGLGFTAWVDNNRVIVGNREMMKKQGVEIPSLDYENRYTKGKRQPVYLAVSGRVFAMFLVSYRANAQVADTLENLRRQGVSVLVNSDDFCISSTLASEAYALPENFLKVLTAADRKALAPLVEYTPRAEGCMAHLGSFASFVGGLIAASGAASGERAASMVQAAGAVFSCLLALLLAFTGGIAQLSLPAVLLYGVAWGVLTLVVPLFRTY